MDPQRLPTQRIPTQRRPAPRINDISERSLTLSYIIALTIIAGLLIICHVLLEGELQTTKRSSALINMSGRQRMLSQRIAGMAAEYRLGIPGARQALLDATNAFESARALLIAEVNSNSSRDPYELQLRELYWHGSRPLAAETRDYIAEARAIADLPPDDPAQPALILELFAEARTPLLDDLEQAVALRQKVAEGRVTNLQHLQSGLLILVLITLLIVAFAIFRPMVRRIVEYNEELILLATTDQLTGTANRRSFIESGAAEIVRARRYGRPVSFLALDVDHFKLINDRHGHPAGDEALIAITTRLQQSLRSLDLLGRVGGEEFAILLPETTIDQAVQIAERLRISIAALQIKHAGKALKVTISIGVVEVSTTMSTLSEVMSAADAALYRAKAHGRNCVVNAAA